MAVGMVCLWAMVCIPVYGESSDLFSDTPCGLQSAEATSLMLKGEYEEALATYRKAEKSYASQNDTVSQLYITCFLYPQMEALEQLHRPEEALAMARRIMIVKDALIARYKKSHNQPVEVSTATPASLAEVRDMLLGMLAVLLLCALFGFLYYRRIIRRKNRAQVEMIDRLMRYKRMVYGYSDKVLKPDQETACALRSYLTQNKVDEDERLFGQVVKAIVDKKLYLNPGLSRDDVIAEVYIPKNKFAQLFQRFAGKSFNRYINSLRMDEAVTLLCEHPEYTIESISTACGMSSMQTFYRVFIETYGLTPTEYRRMWQLESAAGNA
ncbi:MAG: helix-turn-helix transcriptional regulator, partial [Prevotella sp.]